jgi:hypothetical protein
MLRNYCSGTIFDHLNLEESSCGLFEVPYSASLQGTWRGECSKWEIHLPAGRKVKHSGSDSIAKQTQLTYWSLSAVATLHCNEIIWLHSHVTYTQHPSVVVALCNYLLTHTHYYTRRPQLFYNTVFLIIMSPSAGHSLLFLLPGGLIHSRWISVLTEVTVSSPIFRYNIKPC